MHVQSDEALVAYLDGELDDPERRHVEASLDADPALRERLAGLAQSSELVRAAFAEIAEEPVPERLIAAAGGGKGQGAAEPHQAEIVMLKRPARGAGAPPRRNPLGFAAAAGLFGLMLGTGGTLLGLTAWHMGQPTDRQIAAAAVTDAWLDNAAGYYKLTVKSGDNMLIDVPASNDSDQALQKISQNLPQQMRLPNLKPWGLTFKGARLLVVQGRPAAELVYITDNKAIGPLGLVIGATTEPDVAPTIEQRQGVNLLYWRHHGHAYALVGASNIGWLWGIANDIAWQLDAI